MASVLHTTKDRCNPVKKTICTNHVVTATLNGTAECARSAIWQTLVGNRTPTGKVAPEDYRCLLECALVCGRSDNTGQSRGRITFSRLMEQNQHLRLGGRPLSTFFPSRAPIEHDPPASRDALERMYRLWRSKRPLVTLTGHFGLGPAAARAGDVVFVIIGCTVPVVLRPTELDRWQLVGCCYMQGYMEGEALHEVELGTRDVCSVSMC